jgi:hypothetical protein
MPSTCTALACAHGTRPRFRLPRLTQPGPHSVLANQQQRSSEAEPAASGLSATPLQRWVQWPCCLSVLSVCALWLPPGKNHAARLPRSDPEAWVCDQCQQINGANEFPCTACGYPIHTTTDTAVLGGACNRARHNRVPNDLWWEQAPSRGSPRHPAPRPPFPNRTVWQSARYPCPYACVCVCWGGGSISLARHQDLAGPCQDLLAQSVFWRRSPRLASSVATTLPKMPLRPNLSKSVVWGPPSSWAPSVSWLCPAGLAKRLLSPFPSPSPWPAGTQARGRGGGSRSLGGGRRCEDFRC